MLLPTSKTESIDVAINDNESEEIAAYTVRHEYDINITSKYRRCSVHNKILATKLAHTAMRTLHIR